MNQSAVEWLVEKINYHKAWANPEQLEPLIEQAKEMEDKRIKNERVEAYNNGFINGVCNNGKQYD